MVVMEGVSNVHVVFTKTHFEHGTNLERCYITNEKRAVLAGKMSDGVSFDNLLDKIHDNIENIYDLKTLLTRRNCLNIKRDYILTPGRHHPSSSVSVKLWIQQIKTAEEDENLTIYHELTDDDIFFLIMGNKFQKEMLRKYGSQKICVDANHGVNEYDMNLTSLVVVDDFGNVFPCIFCFSSMKDPKLGLLFLKKSEAMLT